MSQTNPSRAQKEASENAFSLKQASNSDVTPFHQGFGVEVDRLLTSKEVCEWLGRSHASLYRDIAAGLIQPPIKIGASSRWPASEIRALIDKAIAKRDEPEAA
jgi:predicted DNA-binding transcriptional regulator AlpA